MGRKSEVENFLRNNDKKENINNSESAHSTKPTKRVNNKEEKTLPSKDTLADINSSTLFWYDSQMNNTDKTKLISLLTNNDDKFQYALKQNEILNITSGTVINIDLMKKNDFIQLCDKLDNYKSVIDTI